MSEQKIGLATNLFGANGAGRQQKRDKSIGFQRDGQEQVFCAHVIVVHRPPFIVSTSDDLFGSHTPRQRRNRGAITNRSDRFQRGLQLFEFSSRAAQNIGRDSTALFSQSEQEVFWSNCIRSQSRGLRLREDQHSPSAISHSSSVDHHVTVEGVERRRQTK